MSLKSLIHCGTPPWAPSSREVAAIPVPTLRGQTEFGLAALECGHEGEGKRVIGKWAGDGL